MICKHILLITFLNEPKLILLHIVKWFKVLLYITDSSIKPVIYLHTVKWSNSFISDISILHSVYLSNSSIWPIDRNLSGASTLGQNRPGSDGNEGIPHIPQSSSITGVLPSDFLMSCLGHSFKESYPFERFNWHIPQPQPTGLSYDLKKLIIIIPCKQY